LQFRAREDLTTERRISLGEQFLVSEREALQLIHSDATHLTVSIAATSAMIYSHTVLRSIHRRNRLITQLLTYLRNSITVALTLPQADRFSDPAVLAWALLVGVLASQRQSPNFDWFMGCLMQACENSDLNWERINALPDLPIDQPAPFHWVLEEKIVSMKDVNTMIMVELSKLPEPLDIEPRLH
jgi:hypothetical protein